MEHDRLDYYLGIWRTVEKLKSSTRITPLESANSDDSLLDQLWNLTTDLQEHTDHRGRAGLRPFQNLRELYDELVAFCQELDLAVENEVSVSGAICLGGSRRRRLQQLMQRFEKRLRDDVGEREVFLAPDRQGLLDYLSPSTFLHNALEQQYFGYLPQIAQRNFADAGKCLVYGLPGAAIPLVLQAVEATLRYYYFRHGGPDKSPDWADMIDWLHSEKTDEKRPPSQKANRKLFPGDEATQRKHAEDLHALRRRYRNAVAHARAYFEAGKPEISLSLAEKLFSECWSAVRELAAAMSEKSALRLQIKISEQFGFDDVVAAYLYVWNPEFPPFVWESIEFDPPLAAGELYDSTVVATDQWPQRIRADTESCLSRKVLRCFRIQPNFGATLNGLLDFVEQCRAGQVQADWNPRTSDFDNYNLLQLFSIIRQASDGEPRSILGESKNMLDKFIAAALGPQERGLMNKLEMKPLYDKALEKM